MGFFDHVERCGERNTSTDGVTGKVEGRRIGRTPVIGW